MNDNKFYQKKSKEREVFLMVVKKRNDIYKLICTFEKNNINMNSVFLQDCLTKKLLLKKSY